MQCTAAMQATSAAQTVSQRPSAPRPQRGSWQVRAAAATGFWDTPSTSTMPNGMDSMIIPSQKNTWIEKPDAVKDFATLQAMLDEIQNNIALRQDTISLLTGEVGRLRSQMGGIEGSGLSMGSSSAASNGASSLQLGSGSPSGQAASMAASMLAARADATNPAASAGALFAGVVSGDRSTKANLAMYAAAVASIVFAGGVAIPVLEDKMGLGGAAYYDFITSNGLPNTMAEVDPIVASHAGGAVGVLTAQLAQEAAAARRTGRVRNQ